MTDFFFCAQRARHKAQRVHALSLFRRWGGRGLASKAMPDGTELRAFLMKHRTGRCPLAVYLPCPANTNCVCGGF